MTVPAVPPLTGLARLSASPVAFLGVLAALNLGGFSAWNALLNNFSKEAAGFDGFDIGLLQSVREIPGFLAFTAVWWLLVMREQTLALVALMVMGIGVALTGWFPTLTGLLITTFVMSVGFHYFETMNHALSLQLLSKEEAPKALGLIHGAASAGQLVAYGGVALVFFALAADYATVYAVTGAIAVVGTVLAMTFFKAFRTTTPQNKGFVLRRRYGLYYALTFMSGARRQVFMAFGGFLLVEKFGYTAAAVAFLLLAVSAINVVAAPLLGRMVARFGERATILLENTVLVVVFLGYAFVDDGRIAGALFVIDGVFFTLVIAQRTYFQKIADPADITPTASVAFTINHIAAVFIPVTFGLIWLADPAIVFVIGTFIATGSLGLALLVPRAPEPGREWLFARPAPAPAPAE